MGKNSEYQVSKRELQLSKYRRLLLQLPEYTHEFLEDKRRSSQINTVIAYAYDLITFFEFICDSYNGYEKTSEVPFELIKSFTYKDINAYQDYIELSQNHNNCVSSIKRRMSAVNGLFKYLYRLGELGTNPTELSSKQPARKEDVIVKLSVDEVQELTYVVNAGQIGSAHHNKIIKHTKLRDYAIITLLLGTGIRVSELVGLDIDDVNFKDKSITVVRKGGKTQKLYFNNSVYLALADYIEFERGSYCSFPEEKALFLSNRKSRMCVRSIQALVEKYSKVAVPDKHISVHKLRSTYGTALYQETKDIKLVADVLGHKDINTANKHYAAQEEENRRRAGRIDPYA